MTVQPEHPTSKHRATAQEAARAAQEVLAEIEKLRAAAQAAADTAGVVAVLDDDGAVAGHSFYVQVPFCH